MTEPTQTEPELPDYEAEAQRTIPLVALQQAITQYAAMVTGLGSSQAQCDAAYSAVAAVIWKVAASLPRSTQPVTGVPDA